MVMFQPDVGTASVLAGIVLLIFYSLPLKKETRSPINKILVGGVLLVSLILLLSGNYILDIIISR